MSEKQADRGEHGPRVCFPNTTDTWLRTPPGCLYPAGRGTGRSGRLEQTTAETIADPARCPRPPEMLDCLVFASSISAAAAPRDSTGTLRPWTSPPRLEP